VPTIIYSHNIPAALSDNAEVQRRRKYRATKLLLSAVLCLASSAPTLALSVKRALASATSGTQASAIVLDAKTGNILASVGDTRGGAPGSVIKPLLLVYALQHGVVSADTSVYCRRTLKVGDRFLPCTHPPDQTVFTAASALAESCNTWFAEMARRLSGPQLEAALKATQLPHLTMNDATIEERQLAVLGLRGVIASPLQLAQAYRRLFLQAPLPAPVAEGLRGSVQYGMANSADVPGLNLLGKTGTASNPGEAWTHGWFAGSLPGRFILVVYVPHGDGGTAASLAGKFFTLAATERNAR
jgi:cell division protein FtsI/penicillin-binding protein 2